MHLPPGPPAGQQLGISQMHVSRMLAHALGYLRPRLRGLPERASGAGSVAAPGTDLTGAAHRRGASGGPLASVPVGPARRPPCRDYLMTIKPEEEPRRRRSAPVPPGIDAEIGSLISLSGTWDRSGASTCRPWD